MFLSIGLKRINYYNFKVKNVIKKVKGGVKLKINFNEGKVRHSVIF